MIGTLYSTICHRIYLQGYVGRRWPRRLRRALARTDLHRAWFCGYHGWFIDDDGVRYSPAYPYAGLPGRPQV